MAHSIYLVEDHEIIREMVREFIAIEPDLIVSGAAASGEEALAALAEEEPELVLVDTSLPGMSGIDLVKRLVDRRPGLRCLMFSGHGEQSYVEKALEAGAKGYILKGRPEELTAAIRTVLGGDTYFSRVPHRKR